MSIKQTTVQFAKTHFISKVDFQAFGRAIAFNSFKCSQMLNVVILLRCLRDPIVDIYSKILAFIQIRFAKCGISFLIFKN